MAEVKTHITRQSVSGGGGGIPRIPRTNLTSNIKDIATPIIQGVAYGLVDMLQTSGNEAKAKFAFNLKSKINTWAATGKNKYEISILRDKALAAAGPGGTDMLTAEDLFAAQKSLKPEFIPHSVKNSDGSVSTFDSNKNLIHRSSIPDRTQEGEVESAFGRQVKEIEANQKAFPLATETLRVQLVDPHKPAPNDPNPDPEQVTKYGKLMKATLQLNGLMTNIRTTINSLTDSHLLELDSDVSELDPPNRQGDNRDKLFIVIEAASLKLEEMNRYSQAGLGGPAQIAPISVFNAMKSEIMNMFLNDQTRDAFGDLKGIRDFMDTLEADIDKSARDAFDLGTDETARKKSETLANTYKAKRSIRDSAIHNSWSPEFQEAVLAAPAMSAIATTADILKNTGQRFAAGHLAEIIAEQATGAAYDAAIRTINSYSTPNPEEAIEIFSAVKVLRDSLISSIDARRMRLAKKAVDGLLANKNIDWSRNPDAKKEVEYIQEKQFSGENMARAESITPGVEAMRKARNQ